MRVLVVDDEPMARRVLKRFLESDGEVQSVQLRNNGEEARRLVESGLVDIAFVDVQMPGMTGFEVFEGIPLERRPIVVFVTAFEEHALQAFQADAAGYLLKPFGLEGFSVMLQRAKERFRGRALLSKSRELNAILGDADPRGGPRTAHRIAVHDGASMRMVPADEVLWIEAADKYVVFHTDGDSIRTRRTLAEIETHLDGRDFLRVHRCNIVAMRRVVSLDATTGGAPFLTLDDGTRVVVSRSRLASVRAALR